MIRKDEERENEMKIDGKRICARGRDRQGARDLQAL